MTQDATSGQNATSAAIASPRVMRVGAGSRHQVADILAGLGLSRPLIVTDRFLLDSGRVAELVDDLAAAGMEARVFSDVVADPTVASIEAGLRFAQEGDHDCVIGFGGGSPLDSAKAIAILSVHSGPIHRFKVPHLQDAPGLPIIAVPTTAGTGSEATRFTIVTDTDTDEKMLCAGLAYLPLAAIIDYELTLSKPRRLTADTGIDSLTHAIEAYVSRRANLFSDGMALTAMRQIGPNLRRVCADPQDRAARAMMMIGATNAGIAFSNSSVALVHGMSRPIGAHFHVPHGLSNAMLLPIVTRFSAPSALARYADCARAIGVADAREGDQAAVARLVEELEALNRDLDVPSPRAHGIHAARWEAAVPVMAAQAIASGSPANNPRLPSEAEIRALYIQAWQ